MALYGKNATVKKERFNIVNERFLTLLFEVLVSDTPLDKRSLRQIKSFQDRADMEFYEKNDYALYTLMKCVGSLVDSRNLVHNDGHILSDKDTCEFKIKNEFTNDIEVDTIDNTIIPLINRHKKQSIVLKEMSDIVREELSLQLRYHHVLSSKDDWSALANAISHSSGHELRENLEKFRELNSDILNYFRETDSLNQMINIQHTSDVDYIDSLFETYDDAKSPRSNLRTGLQLFNKMISPDGEGFLQSCYYMIFAGINTFKSALLDHICRMIQLHNNESFAEGFVKTGRRPTIVKISLENSKNEDNQRLFKMYTSRNIIDMTDHTILKEHWVESYEKTQSCIDISIIHKEANSISIEDIDNILDNIEESGYDVIALVIDYLEIIKCRPEDLRKEQYVQLGGISEDLLSLAKRNEITVISAGQLTRNATSVLNEGKDKGEMNTVMRMNNSFVGLSHQIEKPVTASFYINIEDNPYDKKRYLTVKRGKCRGERSDIEYFAHEIVDGIVLIDDIYDEEPKSKLLLTADFDDKNFQYAAVQEKAKYGSRGSMGVYQGPAEERQPKTKSKNDLKNELEGLVIT